MYGFSGFATNEYAVSRPSGVFGPLVDVAMRVLRSTYGATNAVMLRFRSVLLTSVYGIPAALMLKFRGTTLGDPQTDNNILEL